MSAAILLINPKYPIPSDGCLNLAAAVNVVLYDRAQKLALVPA